MLGNTMRSEADTPINQRRLILEGRLSPASIELIKTGLPPTGLPDTEIIFVQYAYADLPLPKRFDVVFPKNNPQHGVHCACTVLAATQQFAKPSPDIPHGWKTICLIHFVDGVPQMVRDLPVVDGWFESTQEICLCDDLTWEHLNKHSL